MSYATLMVHVDLDRPSDRRVRLASELAQRFSAVLIGISACAPARLPEGEEIANPSEMPVIADTLEHIGAQFRRVAGVGERSVEWRSALDFPTDFVAREARGADLVIVGRSQAPAGTSRSLDPGDLLMRAGRPVLTVPEEVDRLRAQRIVVGWKDTRESRRAVRDAIPILQQAQEVILIELSELAEQPDAAKHLDDVTNYLVRHKVIVAAKLYYRPGRPVTDELIRLAMDEEADLIVTGGYGHSRLGERILGGVTRNLLEASPICCLFSH
jgi:nucleotide-binding universal stress UspA family protein